MDPSWDRLHLDGIHLTQQLYSRAFQLQQVQANIISQRTTPPTFQAQEEGTFHHAYDAAAKKGVWFYRESSPPKQKRPEF